MQPIAGEHIRNPYVLEYARSSVFHGAERARPVPLTEARPSPRSRSTHPPSGIGVNRASGTRCFPVVTRVDPMPRTLAVGSARDFKHRLRTVRIVVSFGVIGHLQTYVSWQCRPIRPVFGTQTDRVGYQIPSGRHVDHPARFDCLAERLRIVSKAVSSGTTGSDIDPFRHRAAVRSIVRHLP